MIQNGQFLARGPKINLAANLGTFWPGAKKTAYFTIQETKKGWLNLGKFNLLIGFTSAPDLWGNLFFINLFHPMILLICSAHYMSVSSCGEEEVI